MERAELIRFQIKKQYANLRTSEKRVADFVLGNETECERLSIEEMARKSGVSQPTVMRFVKAVGFRSYRDFRYSLIAEKAQGETKNRAEDGAQPMYGYRLEREDRIQDVPAKIVATTTAMMEEMLKSISVEDFEKAVQMLVNARRICLFGVENSAAVAKDLLTKLLYLGMDCQFDEDYYIQKIEADNMTEEDVAIGISYSGQSRDVVDTMKIARKAGAKTIIITNFAESLISRWGDVVLCGSQKQWLYGDAIFSRTLQLAVVDMIYMGIILSDYDKFTAHLDRNSQLVADKAYQ